MKSGSFSSFQAAAAPEARVGGERDDEPATTIAVVIAEADGGVVRFRIASESRPLSPVMTISRDSASGNPYSLYGKAVAEWLDLSHWSLATITVAQMTSGTI